MPFDFAAVILKEQQPSVVEIDKIILKTTNKEQGSFFSPQQMTKRNYLAQVYAQNKIWFSQEINCCMI
jgi:hypothetical protein